MDYYKEVRALQRRRLRKLSVDDSRERMDRAEKLLPEAPRWAVVALLEVHYGASKHSGSHSGLRYHPCMDRFMTVMVAIRPPSVEEVDDRGEREKWALLLRCSAHLYRQRDRSESVDLELAVRLSRQALPYVLETGGGADLVIDTLGIWVSSLNLLAERVPFEGDLRDAAAEIGKMALSLDRQDPESGIAQHFFAGAGLVFRLVSGIYDDAEALDAAIDCHELALRGEPHPRPGDGADPQITWYGNLSTALKHRYIKNQDPRDYQAAVTALETAMGRVAGGAAGSADRAQLLMQMSQLHSIKASRTPSPREHDELARRSGQAAERAAEATRESAGTGHEATRMAPVVAFMQALWARAESSRGHDDPATDFTHVPELTPSAVQWVLHHTVIRFEVSQSVRVLDATAALFEAAARGTGLAGPDRAAMLLAQAMVLQLYPRGGNHHSRWDQGRALAREATRMPGARPVSRAQANVMLGIGAYAQRRYVEAADGFEAALDALASLRQPELELEQQLRRIAAASGMVPDEDLISLAASCAIAAGDGQRALALVEKGMTIFSGSPGSPGSPGRGGPTHPLDLPLLAAQGPIISVVTGSLGAHALVATASDVEIVSLSGLSDAEWSRPAGAHPENVINDLLEVLWDGIGVPVLTNLAERAIHPRRIWWLPVGKTAALPLHAAGYHRARDGRRSFLDQTVSSYLADLATLARCRSTPAARPDLANALIAAYPGRNTRAQGYLRGACVEAKDVATELGAPAPLLKEDATVNAVLAKGDRAAIAHYVCHGTAHPLRPTMSGLEFADGRLTVGRLTQQRRSDVWLAYLSACETARRSKHLIAPTLTVGAAFHQTGYRHVIGTLAPIWDDGAAAKTFYRHLKTTDPAAALHKTVRELRDGQEDRPTRWSSLIHFGPET